MAGTMRWAGALAVAGLVAATHAAAQQAPDADGPTYKCWVRGKVVYSQTVCNGKKVSEGSAPKPRVNVRYEAPPQDRAKAMRRGQLEATARAECSTLDGRLRQQEAEFKAKGDAATLQDEMPLVHSKKRYRELGC